LTKKPLFYDFRPFFDLSKKHLSLSNPDFDIFTKFKNPKNLHVHKLHRAT